MKLCRLCSAVLPVGKHDASFTTCRDCRREAAPRKPKPLQDRRYRFPEFNDNYHKALTK